jgi:hypothetical protein
VVAHRYAYELMVGPIEARLDHRCLNRLCVNPEHLRPATAKQNNENRAGAQANSLTGVRGVTFDAGKRKYRARVRHNRQLIHVGWFHTIEEAETAVVAKRNELFTHNELDRR